MNVRSIIRAIVALFVGVCPVSVVYGQDLCDPATSRVVSVEASTAHRSLLEIVEIVKPILRVIYEDGTSYDLTPVNFSIRDVGSTADLDYCIEERVEDARIIFGSIELAVNFDWSQQGKVNHLRLPIFFDEIDFAAVTDVQASVSSPNEVVLTFTVLNPGEAQFSFVTDARLGWRSTELCSSPAPFARQYSIEVSNERELRVFGEGENFRTQPPFKIIAGDGTLVGSKFHGDFCGIGEGELVVTLDRLIVGSDESAASFAVVFKNDLFSNIAGQSSLIFLGASLEFQSPSIFPRIVGGYTPLF
ncbi:hypothetical protein EBB79_15025 [Parasedimentitalea marina]|uniref:Uncharacterized protein n=1 Tax=Parasedimentitalea marina TaxID=2483033 RepID=A0A3T0N4W4_9RHOB|nr:hypothetical protein [Parasedimentitalea marina]AZV79054.1 hypothetical protein EBB79_15025 [Parasedimentitalea marina]